LLDFYYTKVTNTMQNPTNVQFTLKERDFLKTIQNAIGGSMPDEHSLILDSTHPLMEGELKRHHVRDGLWVIMSRNLYVKQPLSLERLMDTSNAFFIGNVYLSDQPLYKSLDNNALKEKILLNDGIYFSSSELAYTDNLPMNQSYSIITFIFLKQWIKDYLQPNNEDYLSKIFNTQYVFSLFEPLPSAILKQVQEISKMEVCDGFDKLKLEAKVIEFAIWALKTLGKRERPESFVNMNKHDLNSILTIKHLLSDNLKNPLTIIELSKKVAMSESKLKNAFRQVYGTSIYQYIINLRMEKGKKMLELEKCSIGEVSDALGYVNPSQFTKKFKEHYNVLPKEFLKK
jgi:AraC-like DNA-binding protein